MAAAAAVCLGGGVSWVGRVRKGDMLTNVDGDDCMSRHRLDNVAHLPRRLHHLGNWFRRGLVTWRCHVAAVVIRVCRGGCEQSMMGRGRR